MSAICHGFVQNAWRKDICSNCFRVRDEHEINSVRSCSNNNGRGGDGYTHNSNTSSSSGTNKSSNGYSSGYATTVAAANGHNIIMKSNHSTSHTMPHPHAVSINVKSSPTQHMKSGHGRYQSPTLGQSGISGIPRIKTASSSTLLSSHSKGLYNNYDNHNHNSSSPVKVNNNNFGGSCKLRGAASLEVISQLGSSSSSSSSNPYGYSHNHTTTTTSNTISSTTNSNHTSPTRRHPSKADKETMNNNSLLTSSARSSSSSTLPLVGSSGSSIASGLVQSCGLGGVGGGSKENILHYSSTSTYNNSTVNPNNNSNCASGSTSSVCPATANALTHPPHQFNSNTSTGNITKRNPSASTALVGGGGSSASTFSSSSSSSSSSASNNSVVALQQHHSANANNSCGAPSSVCVTQQKHSNSSSSSYLNQNQNQQNVQTYTHENQHVNGVSVVGSSKSSSGVANTAGVQMVRVNASNSVVGGGTNSSNVDGDVKSQAIPINNILSKSAGGAERGAPSTNSPLASSKNKIMDETDGDVGRNRSKVTFGNHHGYNLSSSSASRNSKSGGITAKGILKSKDGSGRRKMSVSFPKEVCEVIGYGGDMNGSSSDEDNDEDDEPVPDPQDSHSISELFENNSSYDEKELILLTQKNTSFNSIKTNLMGITCIEIGPIVGCTGGKSMENSSKPLVSIGTFESRKEPLKIRKQGDPEPPKAFNNVKSIVNNCTTTNVSTTNAANNSEPRKFIQKSNGVKISAKVPSSMKNETESKKIVGNSDTAKNNITISGSTNSNNYSKLMTNGYSSSSSNNINNVQVNGRELPVTGNSAISTIQISAEKAVTSSTKITTEKLQSKSNDSLSSAATLMTNGDKNNHNQLNGGQSHSQKPAIVMEKPRPKPILKNSQNQIKNSISSNTTSNTNNAKGNGSNSNNSLSNLIILTDGNNIASKRTSFLRDIINDKEKSLKTPIITNISTPQTDEILVEGQNAGSLDKDSLEASQQPRIVKSELKVDLKGAVTNTNNKKHTTTISTSFDDTQCPPNDLEFDDSLEDSGLDIKNRTEISESDEKSSSGSDSGNENDFSDRGEQSVKIIGASNGALASSTPNVKGGLFISVEEVGESVKKPAKLSPDSVLFSSASEMSASGSSESIPDACNKNSPVQAVNVIPLPKRLAPRPPSELSEVIYANDQEHESEEEVYDDVRSFYKNPADEELEEESLYDDCVAIHAAAAASGKTVTGSYNFTDGARTTLDTDVDGEEEKVILQHNDGIEFIGIRKIDSESFLRQRSPSPKRERSSSASPKARRKVNQFFSTIGKKAGAAFSSGSHSANRTKSPSALSNSSASSMSASAYKRSSSTDEVSMTRTQEIYATLTPTSLKFKGLAPVLQKLSRMDLNGDKEKNKEKEKDKTYNVSCNGDDVDQGKEKIFKKNKISSSIKKFLRFGGKEGESSPSSNKYDFNNSSFMTKTDTSSENLRNSAQFHSACMSTASDESSSIPSCISEESSAAQSESSSSSAHVNTPNASNISNNDNCSSNHTFSDNDSPSGRTSAALGTVSAMGRPPPPPPRVHSLDLLNKVGITIPGHGTNGTVRPARPPPPVRSNRVAPSFVSVFSNSSDIMINSINSTNSTTSNSNSTYSNGNSGSSSGSSFNSTDTPPNKPKRKASMNGHGANSRDLENTYNHITSLNLETLKLIANQTPEKIQRRSSRLLRMSSCPLRWSQFYVSDLSPMSQGIGFAFYKALWEDEPCVLLIEEGSTGIPPFQFECLETSATFEDVVPAEFVTWEVSDYANTGGVKSFVSVLPPISVESVFDYINNSRIPGHKKFFALLQAMDFWHQQEMANLIVLQNDPHYSDSIEMDSIESCLIYVHPVPTHQQKASLHQRQRRPNSSDFEIAMKQLLLHNNHDQFLSDTDRQVLFRRVSGSLEEVEAQLKLFLQLKLFAPKSNSSDLDKIRIHRSERAIQQWLDRERALSMNEAVQRSIQRESHPISPYKKSYLEFLMTPENSAKAVLDMLVDLIV